MNTFQKENSETDDSSEWKAIPSTETRSDHTSTVYKHFIITFGGMKSGCSDFFDYVSILNLKTQEITEVKLNNVLANYRRGHSACLYEEDQIIVFGGKYLKETLNETAVIHIQENTMNNSLILKWRILETKGAENLFRFYHTAQIYKDKMFVFGGADKSFSPINELWSLDLRLFTWTLCKLQKNITGGLLGHSSVLYQDQIFVFGGKTHCSSNSRPIFSGDLWSLDLEKMEWNLIERTAGRPNARIFTSLQEHNGKFYLFGGLNPTDGSSDALFAYDIEENRWQQMTSKNPIAPRSSHTLNIYNNTLVVIGGYYPKYNELESIKQVEFSYNFLPLQEYIELRGPETAHTMLKTLFKDRSLADVKFIVEGQEIPAHKAILAVGCNFFKKMFTSGMMESQAGVIEVPDVKAATFKALIEFIYCNEVRLNEDIACDLLELADKYAFAELRKGCERLLLRRIREDNCVKLANLASLLQLEALEDAVMEFMDVPNRWDLISKRSYISSLLKKPTYKVLINGESQTHLA